MNIQSKQEKVDDLIQQAYQVLGQLRMYYQDRELIKWIGENWEFDSAAEEMVNFPGNLKEIAREINGEVPAHMDKERYHKQAQEALNLFYKAMEDDRYHMSEREAEQINERSFEDRGYYNGDKEKP